MKRILFVADGKSIHTRRWVEHFRDQGVEVHLASFRPVQIKGVTVHVLPTFGLGRLGYVLAVLTLHRLANRLVPDVVHAHYLSSYGFLAAFAGLRPLVVTAWGTDVLISPRESRLMHWFARYAVRHADAVTTVAEHMSASVAELGIPVHEVVCVPFGVDTQVFVPSSLTRAEGTALRLICTRNFRPVYSVHTLLAALREVNLRGLKIEVDLVGEGPLRRNLKAQVDRAGLRPSVAFHGHVNHPELSRLLAQADIFVSPALSDGNNVSLTEAMACGCFPIATDIPANAQWIDHEVNGLLYPPGDHARLAECILQGASDGAWRARAGSINRDIVETQAEWGRCAERMRETYEKAIQRAEKHM